jgi:hypothetical protein
VCVWYSNGIENNVSPLNQNTIEVSNANVRKSDVGYWARSENGKVL